MIGGGPVLNRDDSESFSRRTVIGVAALSALAVGRVTASDPQPISAENTSVTLDADHDSLEAALAATPTGGVLEITRPHTRDAEFKIDRSVTVRFRATGEILITSTSADAIVIAADRIRLEDPVLSGTGGDSAGEGSGIRGAATASEPYVGLQILRPRIREFSMCGIYLEHIYGFMICDVDISRCGYAGVLLLSAINGTVLRGTVRDILQPTGFVNSYGVAVTRQTAGNIDSVSPRSRDVTVEGLTIDGVSKWEGLDTHAGENITFRGNAVYRAFRGIAVVGSKGVPDGPTGTVYAPVNCTVVDNIVSFGRTDGTGERGIVFAGASDEPGVFRELATGRISGNTVSDYGTESSPNGAALQLYATAGVSVSDNTVVRPGYAGLDFNHDNQGAKASGNTVIDAWSNGQPTSIAVKFHSVNNKVTISGTTIVRVSKEAASVNGCGLNLVQSPTNVVLDGGGNDWAAATVATVDESAATYARSDAQKFGFYGAEPVPQATAIPSPAPSPAGLKSAVDGILELLSGVGLMR